jgi:hypothetical protein
LAEHGFGKKVEGAGARYCADGVGRPGGSPLVYFKALFVGLFEGIGPERGIAWRAADSTALRSIARRDTGEGCAQFLAGPANAPGADTPTREDPAILDRKRPKKGSGRGWNNPHDPVARITKMKDGRTHLAHKAEHAVDMDTGVVVSVTFPPTDERDTKTAGATLCKARRNIQSVAARLRARRNLRPMREVVHETGALRRTHPRRHENILKRLLMRVGAFNLNLAFRHSTGFGASRGLHDGQRKAGKTVRVVNVGALQTRGQVLLSRVRSWSRPHPQKTSAAHTWRNFNTCIQNEAFAMA